MRQLRGISSTPRLFSSALAGAILLLASACGGGSENPAEVTDTRIPIATEYVRGANLPIHAKPSEASPLVTTYQNGEAVSVLTRRGDWIEVRTVSGSGWVLASGLATASEASKVDADSITPRFLRAPEPMAEPNAHGEIVLEAQVNSDGDVMSVRTLRNTTGLTGLEARTAAALQKAKFAPIVQRGRRQPFVYEHRVHY